MPRAAPGPVQAPSPNRTDLQTPAPPGIQPQGQPNGIPANPPAPTQPITVPTGLPYGEHQQLQAAQQAQPLAGAPPGLPSGAGDLGAAAKAFQMPTNMSLIRPTERPNEPIHAGLPGSAVAPITPQRQTGTLSSMISTIAEAAGSAALSQLASRAAALGQ